MSDQQMRLPTHYRIEDWVAYGLYWHFRLTKNSPGGGRGGAGVPTLFTVSPVQSTHGDAIPLHHVLSSAPDKVDQSYSVLRLLAAGLRYVFLANDTASRADILFCGAERGLTIECGSGMKYLVSECSTPERNVPALMILAGSPLSWFSLREWRLAAPLICPDPIDPDATNHRLFHSDHTTLLTNLGASNLGDGRWIAPPGNTLFDLSAYVISGDHVGSLSRSTG